MATRVNSAQEERVMDEFLKQSGLYRRKIAKDGSCLFRAVAEQVLNCQGLHTRVRAECVKYLRENRELYESFIEGDFEEYLQRLQDPQSWVGQVEISALAVLYKHDFIIYQNPPEPPVNITENGFPNKVLLCFLNGNHYDSVYPISFSKSAAICQSILYELLYERVCGVDRSVLNTSVKGSKVRDDAVEVEEPRVSEDSDLDEGEEFWFSEAAGKTPSVNSRPPYRGRGRGQIRGGGRRVLPRQAQDSLNPGIFRNVEYEVWMQSQKAQQKRDFYMAAGMQYKVGDRCQARLVPAGRYFSAYIQEVSNDEGPVTVFIEELGEKHTVPLWNLRTASEESWSSVTDKNKRHSVTNGSGSANEWETRGGRKTTRSTSIPYGSQAPTGSAPSNRVQKQHSWPSQASVEAQSQGKTGSSRKPDQDAGGVGVSPAEEEEFLVLELLHKDENNFPTLGASAQAAGEGGRRAERKSSRKKAETETKDQYHKPDKKSDKGKTGRKNSGIPDQRTTSPSSTPSSNSPAPQASKTTKAAPVASTSSLMPAETTPNQSQTAPVASKPASGSAQAASAPVGTPAQSQTAAPTPQNPSTQSQTVSRAVNSTLTPDPSQKGPAIAAPMPKPALAQATPAPVTTTAPSSVTPQTAPTPVSASTTLPTLVHAETIPGTTPAHSQSAPAHASALSRAAQLTTPVLLQTSPVSTPVLSHTPPVSTPVLSHTPPVPTPALSQTTLVPAPTLSQSASVSTPAISQSTSANTQYPEPTPVPSHTNPITSSDLVTTLAPSHITPTLAVTVPEVPIQTPPIPTELPGASSIALAPIQPNPAHTPHSSTPPAPMNISTAPAPQPPSSLSPFHPAGLGHFPMMPHYPPYLAPVPTSSPMLTPPTAISSTLTPPYSHSSETHPYEPAGSPVPGLGSATVPDYLSHGMAPYPQHPHHYFTMPQFSNPYQDPLYPGFPLNDKDEPLQPPVYMSVHPSGKDLPKDISVLRFFFNLGVRAFINRTIAPGHYLAPLTQAYQLHHKIPAPAPSPIPYTQSRPSENLNSMQPISSAPSHSHMGSPIGVSGGGGPAGHFEMQGMLLGPPPGDGGESAGHTHSVHVHMPPQHEALWPAAPGPNTYTSIYSPAPCTLQYPRPPCVPQGGQSYPSTSVGHHRFPNPPLHVGLAMYKSEGGSQRLSAPQVEKTTSLAGGPPHSGGEGNTPAILPVAVDPQQVGGANPVVQMVSVGSVPSHEAESTKLANGNKKDDNTKSSQGGASVGVVSHGQFVYPVDDWELEPEYGDADLRGGRSYYNRVYKAGGRRGQDDRGGGYRGRGSRARRDYSGRGRPDNQPYYNRGYNTRGRGQGYIHHPNVRGAGHTGEEFVPAAQT